MTPLGLLFIIVIAGLAAGVSALARRLGASRWLAFSIPNVPPILWLIWCLATGAGVVGEGGGMPLFLVAAFFLAITIPGSAIAVYVVPRGSRKSGVSDGKE